jgi:uncharacterized protein YbdZ (MbtH family)
MVSGGLWMEVYDNGTPDVQERRSVVRGIKSGRSHRHMGNTAKGWFRQHQLPGCCCQLGCYIFIWRMGSGNRNTRQSAWPIAYKARAGWQVARKEALEWSDFTADACNGVRKLVSTSDGIDWLDMRVVWSPTENILDGTGWRWITARPATLKRLSKSRY